MCSDASKPVFSICLSAQKCEHFKNSIKNIVVACSIGGNINNLEEEEEVLKLVSEFPISKSSLLDFQIHWNLKNKIFGKALQKKKYLI